jgi:hypothetical protein
LGFDVFGDVIDCDDRLVGKVVNEIRRAFGDFDLYKFSIDGLFPIGTLEIEAMAIKYNV